MGLLAYGPSCVCVVPNCACVPPNTKEYSKDPRIAQGDENRSGEVKLFPQERSQSARKFRLPASEAVTNLPGESLHRSILRFNWSNVALSSVKKQFSQPCEARSNVDVGNNSSTE